MLGAIIGDIVGSRFEFNNTHNTNFELFHKACSFTDDTICTMAYRRKGNAILTEAYAKRYTTFIRIMKWFLNYDRRKFHPVLNKREVAKMVVRDLNKTVGEGHTWQRDDSENIYILRGPFIIIKL